MGRFAAREHLSPIRHNAFVLPDCFATFRATQKTRGYEMSRPGSAGFYHEQAERLTYLAVETVSPETRLELLEIAASFQKLADYASATATAPRPTKRSA
jgi:hypothetical protein